MLCRATFHTNGLQTLRLQLDGNECTCPAPTLHSPCSTVDSVARRPRCRPYSPSFGRLWRFTEAKGQRAISGSDSTRRLLHHTAPRLLKMGKIINKSAPA
jgi:hypothetical protein